MTKAAMGRNLTASNNRRWTRTDTSTPGVRHRGLNWKLFKLLQVAALFRRLLRGFRLAFASFQDLLTDFLGGGLDFLHLLADACSGGLVSACRLLNVVSGLINELLQ